MSWSHQIEEKIRSELLRIDPRFKNEIYGGYFYRRMPWALNNFYMRDSLAYLKEQYATRTGVKILDYGCGVGVFLLYLWKHGFRQLFGRDVSEAFIKAGTQLIRRFNAGQSIRLSTVREQDIYNIHGEFDAITIFDFLHEARFRLPEVFNSVAEALRRNGTFLLSLQNWSANPRSARRYYETPQIVRMLEAAGFHEKGTVTYKKPRMGYACYIAGKYRNGINHQIFH